jgi:hypothetical protein
VICGEFLSLGIMGLPNSRRRHLQIVFCSMERNVRSKQKPISAGISKGHPDASGVDDVKATERAVELRCPLELTCAGVARQTCRSHLSAHSQQGCQKQLVLSVLFMR